MPGITSINPRNQKGLQYLFDINDPQSNPESIDMQAIQPTIDMSFGGVARLHDYENLLSVAQSGSSIAGVQTKTWQILSPGNAVGADNQIVVPVGYHFVSWGLKTNLYFDAAGIAAFAGKYCSCEVLLFTPNNDEIIKYHGTELTASGVRLYAPGFRTTENITRNHICVIPAGCRIRLVWWSQDGTVFPANTVVRYYWAGQAFPVGSPLPQCV